MKFTVYVLYDRDGRLMNLQYKRGTYQHLGIFATLDELKEAVDYYGGSYTWKKKEILL